MSNEQKTVLKILLTQTEAPIPDFFKELPLQQLNELQDYVQTVVAYETDGLDELYRGMSQLIHFIPRFILVSISVKYVKPAIAAGILKHLPLRDVIRLNPKFPVPYVCAVGNHLDSQLVAKMLMGLTSYRIEKLTRYMIVHHPAKALDIAQYLDDNTLAKLVCVLQFIDRIDAFLLTEYDDVLTKLKRFSAQSK